LLAVSAATAGPKAERARSRTNTLRIVFSRTNLKSSPITSEIYSITPTGTGLTRLTHNRLQDLTPTWSPSHRYIVFARQMRYNQNEVRIFVMRAGGGGERALTPVFVSAGSPSVSPDGQKIAFTGVRNLTAGSSIWIVRADGSGLHELIGLQDFDPPMFELSGPAWSPDGKTIAFHADCDCENGGPLYLMNADGSGARPLTTPGSYDVNPAWSPDGHTIAFTRVRGNNQIWVVRATGDGEKRIAVNGENPSWSPDGRSLVFNGLNDRGHLRGYCQVIFRIRRDGSHRTVLGPRGKMPCARDLKFAPDDHDPAWAG
jgi:TolB protein